MKGQPHNIRSINTADLNEAVKTLLTAFDNDPLSQWLYPDKTRRQINNGQIFTEALQNPTPGNIIDVTDNADAVAVWYPPNINIAWDYPPNANPNAKELFSLIAKAAPHQPFWYLEFLGARKAGTGAGSALINHRLSLINESVALFTGNENNLKFYASFGFEVISECTVEDKSVWWLGKGFK